MIPTETWMLFIPAAFLLAMAPGPNNILAMSNGARYGIMPAVIGGTGRLVAFAGLITLTVVGLGALLAASATAFIVLKWLGAAYLLYLGIKLWRAKPDLSLMATGTGGRPRHLIRTLARQEFLIASWNPKAILIFTAFFPQFLDPAIGPAWVQLAEMGVVFLGLEFIALALYAAGGWQIAALGRTDRVLGLINKGSGTALIGAGVAMAMSTRA